MDLTNLQDIQALLKTHGLWAKKSFGQNFLVERPILETILETANIQPEDHIVEVGPGLGVLTQELAKKAAKVTTIELDDSLIPLLQSTLPANVKLLHQNALDFTPPTTPYKVVANIPYNITSPLLRHFLQATNPPQTLTLLIQKEVAEKLSATEPNHSMLSLQTQLYAQPKIAKIVPPEAFFPAPKVHSAIIHLQTITPHPLATEILKLASQAFLQKRKKLSNTLRSHQLNQYADQRPQHLSIKDWEALAKNS